MCREATECYNVSFCNGHSAKCPNPTFHPDGTICQVGKPNFLLLILIPGWFHLPRSVFMRRTPYVLFMFYLSCSFTWGWLCMIFSISPDRHSPIGWFIWENCQCNMIASVSLFQCVDKCARLLIATAQQQILAREKSKYKNEKYREAKLFWAPMSKWIRCL